MRGVWILGVAGLLAGGTMTAEAQYRPRVSVDIRYEWSNRGYSVGRYEPRGGYCVPRYSPPPPPMYGPPPPTYCPPPPPRGYWTVRHEQVWVEGQPGYFETRYDGCGRRYQVWNPGSPGYWSTQPVRVWVST